MDGLAGDLFAMALNIVLGALLVIAWLFDEELPVSGLCRELRALRAVIRIRRRTASALRSMAAEARRWQLR